MKKKGNKKMPRPRQEIIDNPIPTSFFMCYAAVLLFVGTGDVILRTPVNAYTIEKNDVGRYSITHKGIATIQFFYSTEIYPSKNIVVMCQHLFD